MSSAQQKVQQRVVKQVKQTSYVRDLFTDIGNAPLVAANFMGLTFICVFGGRKLFFHPDIGVSDAHRNSPETQNEGPQRYQNATEFREQTKFFANTLTPMTDRIMQTALGTEALYDKWHLGFIKNTAIERPLEETNFFDDDLYKNEIPGEYSLSEDNGTTWKPYEFEQQQNQ